MSSLQAPDVENPPVAGPAGFRRQLRRWRRLGVGRTLLLSLAARLPASGIGLVLVLAAEAAGSTYLVGGLASGAFAIGLAAGAPLTSRLIDRFGQTAPLLVASTLAASCLTGAAIVTPAHPVAFLVLAMGAGVAHPPVAACARVIWTRRLAGRDLDSVLTLEASVQEIVFIVGPVVLIAVGAALGYPTAIAICGAAILAATVAFALTPEARSVTGSRAGGAAFGIGPLATPGVRLLTAMGAIMGASFGALEIGIVAFADAEGKEHLTGLLYAAWCAGSLVAGLAIATRAVEDPVRRLVQTLAILGATTGVVVLAPDVWWLGGLLLVAGTAMAPMFAVTYRLLGDVTPDGMLTESYSWLTTGIFAGVAVGSAAAGALVSELAPGLAFAAAGAVLLVAAATVAARAEALAPRGAPR